MTILEFFTSNRHISFCENQMRVQREDFLDRLREKDAEIRRLRVELATRGDRISADALKVVQPAMRGEPVVTATIPMDWQGELNQMLHEEEESTDGVQ